MKIKNKKTAGFTLVELMISVTVLGVIAAISIPAYQNYVTRSQVAESIALFDGKRVGAEDFIHLNGIGSGKEFEIVSPLNSQYIEQGLESYNSTYYDIAFRYGNNSNKELQGKTILFYNETSSTDNILWNCETDIDKKYLPGNLKCDFQEISPGIGGDGNLCTANDLPKNYKKIAGLELVYDEFYDSYYYAKILNEGKLVYDDRGPTYITKDGIKINYGLSYDDDKLSFDLTLADNMSDISYGGNSITLFDDYSDYDREINNYSYAYRMVKKYEENPPKTEAGKRDEEANKKIVNDKAILNKANEFFTKFENDYVENGAIKNDAPKILSMIYENLDRETLQMNESVKQLFNVDNYPDLAALDLYDEKYKRYESYSCSNNDGIN